MARIWQSYRVDVECAIGRPPSTAYMLCSPFLHAGMRAVLLYRLSHYCHGRRGLRPLGTLLKRLAVLTTGAEIHQRAEIAPGFRLPHPSGVVIGPLVRFQGPATVFQQVTIGPIHHWGMEGTAPIIGGKTFFYAGARVLGPVHIGERAQIGPNCVVYDDLVPGSTVLPPEPRVLAGLSFQLREQEESEAEARPQTEPELEPS